MANFDVTTNMNLDAFLTANPTYDNSTATTDDIYISGNTTLTWDDSDSATSFHYRRIFVGDNSAGTAATKRGNIAFTKSNVPVTLVNVYDAGLSEYDHGIGPTASAGECSVIINSNNMTASTHGAGLATNMSLLSSGVTGAHQAYGANSVITVKDIVFSNVNTKKFGHLLFCYTNGNASTTFTLDGLTWYGSTANHIIYIITTGLQNFKIKNSTFYLSRNGQIFITTWSASGSMELNNLTFDGQSTYPYVIPLEYILNDTTETTWKNIHFHNMTVPKSTHLPCQGSSDTAANYNTIEFHAAAKTAPEAITLTLADGADGTLDVTIPSISGNPQPLCELALRVGAAPDFTDYILGRFSQSQTITIGAWNNAGTWTKFLENDSVQVLCRCINTAGTTNGTGANATVTGGGAGTAPGRPTLTVVFKASTKVTATIADGSPAGDTYRIYYKKTTEQTWTAKSGLSAGDTEIDSLVDSSVYEFVCVGLNTSGALGVPTETKYVWMADEKLIAVMNGILTRLKAGLSTVVDRNIIISDPVNVLGYKYPVVIIGSPNCASQSASGDYRGDFRIMIRIVTSAHATRDGSDFLIGTTLRTGIEKISAEITGLLQAFRATTDMIMPKVVSYNSAVRKTPDGNKIAMKDIVYSGRVYI